MRKIIFILLFSTIYLLSFAQIEEGKATFYADSFEGKKTASGDTYSGNIFTAAHSSYPFGTEVLVTNKANGKSLIVKVNDRDPNGKGNIIKLSKSAAENVGIASGADMVEIQTLGGGSVISSAPVAAAPSTSTNIENPDPVPAPAKVVTSTPVPTATSSTPSPAPATVSTAPAPTTAASPSTTGGYLDMPTPIINSKTIKANFAVQLGSYRDLNNLNFQLAKFKSNSFASELNIYETWKGGKKLYKILVGPYPIRKEAESKMRYIKDTYKLQSFVFAVK